MAKQRKRLGEILYKAKLVEKQALINAIKTSKTNQKRLGQVLLELGLIDEDTLAKVIAKQFGLHYVNLDTTQIPSDASELIPQELMKRHNVLPLGMNNGKLRLVISDPLDLEMMDAIRLVLLKSVLFLRTLLTKLQRKRATGLDTVSTQQLLSLPILGRSCRLKHSVPRAQPAMMTLRLSGW
jgi:type IV pilus assembly protein PilB